MQLLEEIKALKGGKKELRNFGLTMGIVLGVIAGLLLWKGRETYTYFIVLSLFFFVGGFAFRPLLRPIYYVWMTFATILGWVMTRVILCVVFYIVISPISLAARFLGKSFMDIAPSEGADTYWKKREPTSFDKDRCERQY
ncbi:MAG: SxtJ family membrane protein [Thermodesulfobacteriota bacterium]